MRQSSSIQKHGDILAWLYSLAKNRRGQTDRQTDRQPETRLKLRTQKRSPIQDFDPKT